MKINEALGELKRLDGDLNKLYDKRAKLLVAKPTLYVDKMTLDEIKAVELKFSDDRKKKYFEVEAEISATVSKIVDLKTKIMQKNAAINFNDSIIRLKMVRIELSKLMELVKSERYYAMGNNDQAIEELGIQKRIKDLEDYKRKLDSALQGANWQTEL